MPVSQRRRCNYDLIYSNSFLLLEKHLLPGLILFHKESKWPTVVGSFYSLAGGDLSRKVPGHDYGTTESSIVKFAKHAPYLSRGPVIALCCQAVLLHIIFQMFEKSALTFT